MKFVKFLIVFSVFAFSLIYSSFAAAQIRTSCIDSCGNSEIHKFKPQQIIAPVALFTLGAIGSKIDDFKEFDFGIERSSKHHGFVVEDLTQYIPAVSFYALKLAGVESKHNYRDASIILIGSYCISSIATLAIKEISNVERPNYLDNKSFPSGHATIAFMSAEFLRMEYKDTSPWIGVAGYAVATGTALARIRHNEHWTTDLLAGAGVGILSTKIAYWVYPAVQKMLFGKILKKKSLQNQSLQSQTPDSPKFSFIGIPYYNGESTGFSLALQF